MTRFEAELALSSIEEHPSNPRHTAVADDDMVASIREHGVLEPAIVAPHPTKPAKYVLIAGHRRRDGAKKAKLKAIPALIREDLDTEAQQIEAMIIENGHRVDLTPIEEAEGYAQLELLGYKPAAIAAAVGRNIKTVRERLKLLKLSESTQKRLHQGQLTIEHAAAIGEFSDPDIIAKLEKVATSGRNLEYEISNARQLVDRRQRNAERIAALLDAGATEYTLPEGKNLWQVTSGADRVVATVHSVPGDDTFPSIAKHHAGCLRFHRDAASNWPTVTVLCDSPAKHADERPSDAQAERDARYAQERAEQEQRRALQTSAREARTAHIRGMLDSAGKVTLPAIVRDLLRVLLPQTLVRNEPCGVIGAYQQLVGVHEDDRWSEDWWNPAATEITLFTQHVDEIAAWSDAQLIRGVIAILLADAEYQIGDTTYDVSAGEYAMVGKLVSGYLDFLSEAGHVATPVEEEILASIAAGDQADVEAAAS